MPLPTLVKTLAEKKVGEFCKKRVPPHVLDKVNISFKIRGNSVTVFENRAPWHSDMKEWTSMPVAQMRFDEKTREWTLFCADRNDKWHKYYALVNCRINLRSASIRLASVSERI